MVRQERSTQHTRLRRLWTRAGTACAAPLAQAAAGLAVCLVVLLSPSTARAQNALQQFAACMGGPSATPDSGCEGFAAGVSATVDTVQIVFMQPAKRILRTDVCQRIPSAAGVEGRGHAYSGIGFAPGYGVTSAAANIDNLRPSVCDDSGNVVPPAHATKAFSLAWVGVVSSDLGWAQLGWTCGANLGPEDGEGTPAGAGWLRHYFEYNGRVEQDANGDEVLVEYYRYFPPFPTPTVNGSTYYSAELFDPTQGMWSLHLIDDDFNFLVNNRALTSWEYKYGLEAQFTTECLTYQDRVPGTLQRPCVFAQLTVNDPDGSGVSVPAEPTSYVPSSRLLPRQQYNGIYFPYEVPNAFLTFDLRP